MREIHRTKHEGTQDKRKLELRIKALDNERQALEKLVMAGINRDVEAGTERSRAADASGRNGAPEKISSEQMNEALQGDNPAAAVERMIESRLATIRNEQEAALDKIQSERTKADEELLKSAIEQNIQEARNSEDMKSFAENQQKFGTWLERIYGKDDFGLRRINEICADAGELRSKYQMFLRDTFDFTDAIQKAKAEGEAVASHKEKLAPVKSSPEPAPEKPRKERPQLRPADQDYGAMEEKLGMHRRGGSFIDQKSGLFR